MRLLISSEDVSFFARRQTSYKHTAACYLSSMFAVPSGRPGAISGQCQFPARRAAAGCLSAAALILLAACSAGSKSAATSLTPRQAVLAAAKQAQQITSAT